MDPVSITASAIAFAHLCHNTAACITLVRKIKSVPQDIQDLQNELVQLNAVLESAKVCIDALGTSHRTSLANCLLTTKTTVEEVEDFLARRADISSGAKAKLRRAKWLLNQSSVARLRGQLAIRRNEWSMLFSAETLNLVLLQRVDPSTCIEITAKVDPPDPCGLRQRHIKSDDAKGDMVVETVREIDPEEDSPTAISEDPQPEKPLQPLHTRKSTSCHCHCHRPWRLSTPRYLRSTVGRWSLSSADVQLLKPRCSPCCRCSAQTRASLSYVPPSWASTWAVYFSLMPFPFGQPEPLLKTRHFVPSDAYRLAQVGDVSGLQRFYISGKGSIHDASPEEGQSALLVAIWCGKAEVIRFLLDHGAKTDEATFDGLEVTDAALRHVYGFVSPAGPLMSHLMDLPAVLEEQQLSLAHRIVLGQSSRDLDEVLTDSPELANAIDYRNRSPLWWAALRKDVASCRTLLKFGADPNNADYQGETIMQNAAGTDSSQILSLLVGKGGSIHSDENLNETPLHYAARSDSRAANVKLLLERGADANATSANGVTAMHEALQVDAIEVAKLLVERGMRLGAKDMYGDCYWHLAVRWGAVKILALLMARGCDLKVRGRDGKSVWDLLEMYPNAAIEKLLLGGGSVSDADSRVVHKQASSEHVRSVQPLQEILAC